MLSIALVDFGNTLADPDDPRRPGRRPTTDLIPADPDDRADDRRPG